MIDKKDYRNLFILTLKKKKKTTKIVIILRQTGKSHYKETIRNLAFKTLFIFSQQQQNEEMLTILFHCFNYEIFAKIFCYFFFNSTIVINFILFLFYIVKMYFPLQSVYVTCNSNLTPELN